MLCSSYENCINIGIFECCRRFKWVVQIRNEQYQWPQVILLNCWMSQSSVNKLVVFLINQSAILSWNFSENLCYFQFKSIIFRVWYSVRNKSSRVPTFQPLQKFLDFSRILKKIPMLFYHFKWLLFNFFQAPRWEVFKHFGSTPDMACNKPKKRGQV